MIVLDASAVVDLLIPGAATAGVRWHLDLADQWVAPEQLLVEVPSALWRLVRAGGIDAAAADALVGRLAVMPIVLMSHRELLPVAWGFREANRLTDSFYLACARAVASPLLTTDRRLARSHHGVTTIVV